MKITKVDETGSFNNPHQVQAKRIFESEKAAVIHMMLKPGESLKPHVTPVDVLFYVLQGEPDIEIGDEKVRVSPDTVIESPAKIPHCVYNETDGIARFLVIKLS